jgi:hypothetical protein
MQRPPYAAIDVVVDTHAPSFSGDAVVRSSQLSSCTTLSGFATPVCSAASLLAFYGVCNDSVASDSDAPLVEVAPCMASWQSRRVATSTSSQGCVAGENGGGGSDVASSSDGGSGSLAWQPVSESSAVVNATGDGLYRVSWRVVDGAGNVGETVTSDVWLDTARPTGVPTFVRAPDKTSFTTAAVFEVQLVGDKSPGLLSFVYQVSSSTGTSPLLTAGSPEPSNDDTVQLSLPGVVLDESYTLSVWAQDQAGWRSSRAAVYSWRTASVLPEVRLLARPANVSALRTPTFVFSLVWPNAVTGAPAEPDDAAYSVSLVGVSSPHAPCDELSAPANCSARCSSTRCEYVAVLDEPGTYTLQVQPVLAGRSGDIVAVLWEYRRCSDSEYAVVTHGDAIHCERCPPGADCTPHNATHVLQQPDIVARAGWWASPSSDGLRYHRCPRAESCLHGADGVRARCAVGYAHLVCSQCADDYFEQFGKCTRCPSSRGRSAGATIVIVLAIIAMSLVLFAFRSFVPVGVVKVGISMVQIIASANSAYSIPWPPVFSGFMLSLRVFLIDVASITQLGCSQPVTYYTSLCIALVGLKVALLALLLGPWLWRHMQLQQCKLTRVINSFRDRRRLSKVSEAMSGRRRGSLMSALVVTYASLQARRAAINWSRVFKVCFSMLFLAYPGVSVQILRMFKCLEIDGAWWLAVDMRLRCFDTRWYFFAVYAGVMGVLYVAGLPAVVFVILWRRRHKLHGDPSDPFVATTQEAYGFLYLDYGPGAWWWEVEELLRKLLLTAVVVVLDDGSPLQVALAVLVSGWAHVLHAMYKPWGVGSVMYRLQHGSLLVTFFVFLMGLLFKLDGVSLRSRVYSLLAFVMLVMCIVFIVTWVILVLLASRDTFFAKKRQRLQLAAGAAHRLLAAPADSPGGGVAAGGSRTGRVSRIRVRDPTTDDAASAAPGERATATFANPLYRAADGAPAPSPTALAVQHDSDDRRPEPVSESAMTASRRWKVLRTAANSPKTTVAQELVRRISPPAGVHR